MTYDLAAFDFDGTLADSREWFLRSLGQAADRFGFRKVNQHEIEELRSCSTPEIIRRLEVPGWKIPFIARYMRQKAANEADQITLYPGVEDALTALRQRGVRLAVVSSNGEGHIRRMLGPAVAGAIASYSCGASLYGKAAKLRKVLRHCRVTPDRAIFIGDETRDVEAAHAAGTASGAVLWGYASAAALERVAPTLVLRSMADLARL